jgi:iron complex transport system substrate-binding protein
MSKDDNGSTPTRRKYVKYGGTLLGGGLLAGCTGNGQSESTPEETTTETHTSVETTNAETTSTETETAEETSYSGSREKAHDFSRGRSQQRTTVRTR